MSGRSWLVLLGAALAAGASPSPEAARAHEEGMRIETGPRGKRRLRDAIVLLEKAVKLEPDNPEYLGDYAGTCLKLADEEQSYSWAVKGRDNMEKTIVLNPHDLKAREGLMQFYAIAPWPLGRPKRAVSEAAEIARQDPRMGIKDELLLAGIFEKKGRKSLARDAYLAAQHLDPDNGQAAAGLKRLGPSS